MTAKKCFFCGSRDSDEDCRIAMVYQHMVDFKMGSGVTEKTYEACSVRAERCSSCATKHRQVAEAERTQTSTANAIFFVALGIGIVSGVLLKSIGWGFVITLGLGVIAMIVWASLSADEDEVRAKVESILEGSKPFTAIEKKIKLSDGRPAFNVDWKQFDDFLLPPTR